MSFPAGESVKKKAVESGGKKEDLFTRQIRSHSSSKVT